MLTQAESQLDIKLLSPLAEPHTISTGIPGAELHLTLAWGEITTLVTGYQLLKRTSGLTCLNNLCSKYRQALEGKNCPECKRALRSSEITKVTDSVEFEQPYQTQYQAPCVQVEMNERLSEALSLQMNKIKSKISATYGDDIPDHLKQLWRCAPEFVALHSLFHQVIKAVPSWFYHPAVMSMGLLTIPKKARLVGCLTPAMAVMVRLKLFSTNCPYLRPRLKHSPLHAVANWGAHGASPNMGVLNRMRVCIKALACFCWMPSALLILQMFEGLLGRSMVGRCSLPVRPPPGIVPLSGGSITWCHKSSEYFDSV